jgi:hypothetical protein
MQCTRINFEGEKLVSRNRTPGAKKKNDLELQVDEPAPVVHRKRSYSPPALTCDDEISDGEQVETNNCKNRVPVTKGKSKHQNQDVANNQENKLRNERQGTCNFENLII